MKPNLARAARKIDELPTDDGSILDTIAGAILRIFVRINQLEAENARLAAQMKLMRDQMRSENEAGPAAAPRPIAA